MSASQYFEYYKRGDLSPIGDHQIHIARGFVEKTSVYKNRKKFKLFHYLEYDLNIASLMFSDKTPARIRVEWFRTCYENTKVEDSDEVLLIGAFEHMAKGALMKANFTVHNFPKSRKLFGYDQKNTPIPVSQIQKEINNGVITKLENKTIPASYLFEPSYSAIIGLPPKTMEHLKMVTRLRNQIHFSPIGRARSLQNLEWLDTIRTMRSRMRELTK